MNSQPSLSAVVLAGGRSRRMGTDKALLKLGSETLLARTCRIAMAVCSRVTVVTPWPDRYRDQLPANVTLLPEATPAEPAGPLMGFLQALPQQQTAWTLLLACDLPRLQAATLEGWAQDLAHLPETVLAYVPRSGDRWEPLCGFYRRQCLSSLETFVALGDRAFQRWLATIPVQPVPTASDELFFNCNTPADWATLQRPD